MVDNFTPRPTQTCQTDMVQSSAHKHSLASTQKYHSLYHLCSRNLCNTDNAHTFRTTTEPFSKSYEPRSKLKGDKFHNPRQTQWKKRKSCSICAQAMMTTIGLVNAATSATLTQFMAKARQITQFFEAQGESDVDEFSDHEDSTSSARLVSA